MAEKDLTKLSDADLDKLVSQKMASQASSKLNDLSDEELDKLVQQKMSGQPEGRKPFTGEGYIRGALKGLPVAGGAIGGIMGSLPGAALGAAGGAAIQQAGEAYLNQKTGVPQQSPGGIVERLKYPAQQALFGAAGEGAGQLLGRGISLAAQKAAPLLKTGLKAEAPAIQQAAQRLEITPTKGMLSNTPFIQNMESSLEQAPSIWGAKVRQGTEAVRSGLSKAAGEIVKDAGSNTAFGLGEDVKAGIVSKVHQRYDPISANYDELKRSLGAIEIKPATLNAVARNIENLPDVTLMPSAPWAASAKRYADAIKNVKSAEDIKTIKTIAGKELSGATDYQTKSVIGDILGKLQGIESRSIREAAIEAARSPGEGKTLGLELIKDLRGTNKQYRELMQSLKGVTNQAKLQKNQGVASFLDVIEKIPSERIVDKLFNTKSLESLRTIQREFPDQFEQMRRFKISEIAEESMNKGQLDPVKLVKSVNKLEPEISELIFGAPKTQILEDIGVIINSFPSKIGASGTPQGIEYTNILSLRGMLSGIERYLIYRAAGAPEAVLQKASQSFANPRNQSILGTTIIAPFRNLDSNAVQRRMNEVQDANNRRR